MKLLSNEGLAYRRVHLLTSDVARADIENIERRGMERLNRAIQTNRKLQSLSFYNFLTYSEKQDIAELRLGLALFESRVVNDIERAGEKFNFRATTKRTYGKQQEEANNR